MIIFSVINLFCSKRHSKSMYSEHFMSPFLYSQEVRQEEDDLAWHNFFMRPSSHWSMAPPSRIMVSMLPLEHGSSHVTNIHSSLSNIELIPWFAEPVLLLPNLICMFSAKRWLCLYMISGCTCLQFALLYLISKVSSSSTIRWQSKTSKIPEAKVRIGLFSAFNLCFPGLVQFLD